MLIRPKKNIAELYRIPNSSLERCRYLRLDKNENNIGFSEEVLDDFRAMITSDFITTYPDVCPLYQALAQRVGIQTSQLYLAAGSDGAIKSTFEVYVEPHDEVLLICPTYAMFSVYAKMFQAKLSQVFYDKNLCLSAEKVLEKMSQTTRLVCIANPNSPTGTIFSQQEIKKIVETARNNGTLVLVDEAYYQYCEQSAIELLNVYDNLIITRTFSKALGLASARLGYIVSSERIIADLLKVRPMYEVNSFAVRLGVYLLEHPNLISDHVEQVRQTKRFVENVLSEMGLQVPRSHTNFVLINVGGRERSAKIAELMYREKILIRGGFEEPCLEPYIRVGLGSINQMAFFIEKLKLALRELSQQELR